MTIHEIIRKIATTISHTFAEVDTWFDKPEDLRQYKPADGGWSISENLEHIALTSHFLLILIDKGTRKALQQAEKYSLPDLLKDYHFSVGGLDQIGQHMAFEWIRPGTYGAGGDQTTGRNQTGVERPGRSLFAVSSFHAQRRRDCI
ncbi:MAG: DinB family protein [Chitinophagaceae bacterium]